MLEIRRLGGKFRFHPVFTASQLAERSPLQPGSASGSLLEERVADASGLAWYGGFLKTRPWHGFSADVPAVITVWLFLMCLRASPAPGMRIYWFGAKDKHILGSPGEVGNLGTLAARRMQKAALRGAPLFLMFGDLRNRRYLAMRELGSCWNESPPVTTGGGTERLVLSCSNHLRAPLSCQFVSAEDRRPRPSAEFGLDAPGRGEAAEAAEALLLEAQEARDARDRLGPLFQAVDPM